ncbi:hypothetical protein [Phosphitispora sp. TUW77]|uniref:hypothetical protein n=1 Tax=Phosphitispora sp. TUW77 TaxID=3152361 RepID=UPI003AB6C9D8
MSLPAINYEKFMAGTTTQVEINRFRNTEKDEDKPLELWGLILGRPFGNLMAAIEDKRLDDIEAYVFQVSAVLAEIYVQVQETRKKIK